MSDRRIDVPGGWIDPAPDVEHICQPPPPRDYGLREGAVFHCSCGVDFVLAVEEQRDHAGEPVQVWPVWRRRFHE